MLRRDLRGSAIVGALVLPRILRASSGMWAEGGDTIARVLTAKSTGQTRPSSACRQPPDLVSPVVSTSLADAHRARHLGHGHQAHPHAGITPTTYLISGGGRHTDSPPTTSCTARANSCSSVPPIRGGVQRRDSPRWRNGAWFQIWLNTPSQESLQPSTVIHEREETPIVELGDAEIKVMIGSLRCTRRCSRSPPSTTITIPAGGHSTFL